MKTRGFENNRFRKMLIMSMIVSTLGLIMSSGSISEAVKDNIIEDSEYCSTNNSWVWSGNFTLEDDIVVGETDSLTVEPGAIIIFKTGTTLKVLGTLYANGTPEQPIHFYGEQLYNMGTLEGENYNFSPYPSSWLYFRNETSRKSVISYAFFKSLGIGITCSSVRLSNCYLSNNSRLDIQGVCSPEISNNTFRDNGIGVPKEPWYYTPYKDKSWSMSSGPTILCSSDTTAVISNNTIAHNGGFGLDIQSASPRVENNKILKNRQGGIFIQDVWVGFTSNPVITGNNITNHGNALTKCNPPNGEKIYPSLFCPIGVQILDSNANFYNNSISNNEIGISVEGKFKTPPTFNKDSIINNAFGVYALDGAPIFQDCYLNNIAYDFWVDIYSHIKAYNTTFDDNKIYIEETSKLETENRIYYPIAGGLTIAGIIVCLFLGATEVGKYKFFAIFFPLYSKLKHEQILDQFVRGQIYGLIRGEPGIYYSKIKRVLKVGNGTLAYHLSVLDREGFIRSKRSRFHKKFFPTKLPSKLSELANKYPEGEELEEGIKYSDLQEKILTLIKNNPGIVQTDIASKLDAPKQTISYNIKTLVRSGIIELVRAGNQTKCYFKDENSS